MEKAFFCGSSVNISAAPCDFTTAQIHSELHIVVYELHIRKKSRGCAQERPPLLKFQLLELSSTKKERRASPYTEHSHAKRE